MLRQKEIRNCWQSEASCWTIVGERDPIDSRATLGGIDPLPGGGGSEAGRPLAAAGG